MALILIGLRATLKHTVSKQDEMIQAYRTRVLSGALLSPPSWHNVAEQLAADALRENLSVDTDAGIMDISTQPSLRFTLMTRDGRAVAFTTDPKLMHKAKLIRRGDRVVNLSKVSPICHAEATMLWQTVLAQRNVNRVTPPRSAHWYVVARVVNQRQTKSLRRRR
jgi:hypothetical protein